MNRDFEERPWGQFERFVCNEVCTVKVLAIKANEQLSLQKHTHRDEFWKVLDGEPKIVNGDDTTKAKPGDEFYIKKETPHRIITEDTPVRILEIPLGHFDEYDEERIEDKYNR